MKVFSLKRFTAMLLCLIMVIGCLPMGVLAAGVDGLMYPNTETLTSSAQTVYKKVDSPTTGREYIIANTPSDASSANAQFAVSALIIADGTVKGVGVTVTNDDGYQFITSSEFDSVNPTLWTFGQQYELSRNVTLKNGENYLAINDTNGTDTLGLSSSAQYWTLDNSKIYQKQGQWYPYQYPTYKDNTWSIATSTNDRDVQTLAFYEKTTEEISNEYSLVTVVEGEIYDCIPTFQDSYTHKVPVKTNETKVVEIGYNILKDFADVVPPSDFKGINVTYELVLAHSTGVVASDLSTDGKLTLNSDTDVAVVRVSCTWEGLPNPIDNYVRIEAIDGDVVDDLSDKNSFPEYPEQGSIRFNKTAVGVNWDDTAVAQVELSMTGVPYNDNNEMDVVIMVDMSASMKENSRLQNAKAATTAAVEALVKNIDGSFNENRIAIYTFSYASTDKEDNLVYPDSIKTSMDLSTCSSEDALNEVNRQIGNFSADGGTNYAAALWKCNDVLEKARQEIDYNRKQYVIFVTDGLPTAGFAYIVDEDPGYKDYGGTGYEYNDPDAVYATLAGYTEYYSHQMKSAGVGVYSVSIDPGKETKDNYGRTILKKIAGVKGHDANDDAYASYYQETEASKLKEVFASIVNSIKFAATNTKVNDIVGKHYDLYLGGDTHNGEPLGIDTPICLYSYPLNADGSRNVEKRTLIAEITFAQDMQSATVKYTADGTPVTVNKVDGVLTIYKQGSTTEWLLQYRENESTAENPDPGTGTFDWNIGTVNREEYVLTYYVILKKDYWGQPNMYPTNKSAKLSYTNYLDRSCEVMFPVPQLTWKGAQVSYTFYLVNTDGKPVNHAGIEIPFAEAVFVTDVFTSFELWTEKSTEMKASLIAKDLLAGVYKLHDEDASYTIQVYQNEDALDPKEVNQFTIGGTKTDRTTVVYNTLSDVEKYSALGTYDKTDCSNLNFASTTVAFAVEWVPELKEDVAVFDWGLPMSINVAANDFVTGSIIGLVKELPANVVLNKGAVITKPAVATALDTEFGSVKISEGTVIYTPTTMLIDDKGSDGDVFYYVAEVKYRDLAEIEPVTRYMYSSVTMIPATSVYFEAEDAKFVEYGARWEDVQSKTPRAVNQQDTDRPGENVLGQETFDDVDNNYGYDSSYLSYIQFSGGAAKKVNVKANDPAVATFTFKGTGFDIVSLTNNTTGTILVQITGKDKDGKDVTTNLLVDTFYGYAYRQLNDENGNLMTDEAGNPVKGWVLDDNADTLYQVPVIKWSGEYNTYTVKITASYAELFDHGQYSGAGNYDFYLDAIRIYDPEGKNPVGIVSEAYAADNEASPQYFELRNLLIDAKTFDFTDDEDPTASVVGAVFIDRNHALNTAQIKDYRKMGPKNEVYLAPGQSVAFTLSEIGDKNLQIAMKSANGKTVTAQIKNPNTSGYELSIATASDLYYKFDNEVKENLGDDGVGIDTVFNKNAPIIISNTSTLDSGAILSITNIKITGNSVTDTASMTNLYMDVASIEAVLMSLNAPVAFEADHFDLHIAAKNLKVGQKFKAVATTSDDVAFVEINGEKVTKFKTNAKTGLRSWTLQLTADEVGDMTISAVAYNENGVASESVEDSITVTAKNNKKQGGKKH